MLYHLKHFYHIYLYNCKYYYNYIPIGLEGLLSLSGYGQHCTAAIVWREVAVSRTGNRENNKDNNRQITTDFWTYRFGRAIP